MLCTKCGTSNPPANNFCAQCGSALALICVKCKAENPSTSNFCGRCGAPLRAPAAGPSAESAERGEAGETAPVPRPDLSGERRHLTVLFCDLVGSTEIAAKLDPEEWRETAAGYQRAAAESIARFGGHVAKFLGDGVMAFFGYPEAHDNDAERAARAGLGVLDAIAELNKQPGRPELSARVGIDSGAVVVGIGAGKETDVFGDAPNIAARVEAAAEPGTVLITSATHRLVSGMFVIEDRGTSALKGYAEPFHLYRVIRPSRVRGRLAATAARHGLTPFVGREDESRILMTRWERTLDGEGQVARMIGEAGIGKSRLVRRFHEQIDGTPHTWVECATAPFFQNSPFYPVATMLRELLEMPTDQPDAEQFARLEPGLLAVGLKPAEAIPLIAPLLNLGLSDRYPASSLPPDQQRRRLLATLVEWVLGAARAQPLVIVTEDLHWADPSTLDLIQMLVEQSATSPLLLLYTARPEFKSPWTMRSHHTQIRLNRLGTRDVREMIAQVTRSNALTEQTVATVVARTGGVPLFVEELTRAVLERGDDSANREVPVTLHDSLMARLDRLGVAKEVAQVAAVIGREFSYELLSAVSALRENELQSALAKLAEAELVYTRGMPPEATYTFKHALIQDAAYGALLKARRRELHRDVADALNRQFSELAEERPEVIAHHYAEAGLNLLSVPCWQRAGQRALERSANVEAISHFKKGLELLNTLADAPDRAHEELLFQTALGHALSATKGWSDPGAGKAYARSLELCRQLGDSAQLSRALYGSWAFYTEVPQLQTALDLAQQFLTLAEKTKTCHS